MSTPSAVTIDGYAGTFREVTAPAQADLDRCSAGRFQTFALSGGTARGWRHFERVGHPELLWVLDVDGHALVIDALATEQERAELEQMVGSIRIDRVNSPAGQ